MRTISHLYRHSDGIELDCELEYDPGQAGTMLDPPLAPAAYLITAKVAGVDIYPLLADGLVASIEESAIWSQES